MVRLRRGRGSRRLALCLVGLLVGAAGIPAFAADIPVGKSKTLGITFRVEGGSQWCAPNVEVSLVSDSPDAFTRKAEQFQQMLGRIRGIIQSECPPVRAIHYRGADSGQQVLEGGSYAFTNWVFVAEEQGGQTRPCRGPVDAALCEQRWKVFQQMRSLFLSGDFNGVKLIRYLTTTEGADVEWVGKDKVVGRAFYLDNSKGQLPVWSASDLVDLQIAAHVDKCSGEVENYDLEDINDKTAYEGMDCLDGRKSYHQHMVAVGEAAGFWVVAVSSFAKDGVSARQFAEKLKAYLKANAQ